MKYITKMNIFEKKLEKYLKSSKKEKGELLNAVCEIINLGRKQTIRNFRKVQLKNKSLFTETRGRKKIYGNEVNCLLKELWKLSYKLSGELLHPVLEEYLKSFKKKEDYSY